MQPRANRRVTREEVARLAGTSVAVVSYVVNDGPRPVAEATRQRVLQAIKDTGYQPNGIARALASGTTRTFGAIVPNIANPFVAALAHELLQESMKYGHVMLLGDSGDSSQQEREVVLSLLNRQTDGLIYISVDRHPYSDLIRQHGTPVVMLDGVSPAAGIAVLRVDERRAAKDVTLHLLSHGYQRVGVISGPLSMLNTRDRLAGWRDAMDSYRLPVNDAWIVPADYTREGGYLAARQLLAEKQYPDALFVCNEPMAIGCLRALAEQGINVPDDLALVCFNGTDQAAYHQPSLTCVRQPIASIASSALKILREWQGGGGLTESQYFLQTGRSCGCVL
ncbi:MULTISPECIES: LacI family DNA-binding transcriptional regulator [unclassified Tatumella]|mgnify:CR=1 FL=1|uniref:LacI family DNA-binding transcriptional regulator n=1 Tax=unclassified Tatumella TaxID=2649542 RepID=UPI001BAFA9F5|nr:MULTISPECIES: LacI family DNA-binding transcriptional regulator [unclassified Tatumella]MBS0876805.1 LacI family DNA-binding transcriptional regulator [Tatumella sp. JGM82]MBS0889770.1 LacI family DNA-binding transcriptional regulator [Tatumella sp. JGM94]MBS0901560.1 LacI family DNA-binding transcriptional regulator [Tatumella sp. JGM100]